MSTLRENAKHHLDIFSGYARRGITGWVSSARGDYENALRAVLAVEDAEGVTAAAGLSDRLRRLYHDARDAGVLTTEDIHKAENAVFGKAHA